MEEQFNVGDVVWARARKPKSEIFWPAQVVETEKTPKRSKKKVIASVKFLGEDTYEDVKDAKDIKKWECNKQLIQMGRASLENEKPQKKICFNKGVREAKNLFAQIREKDIDHTNKSHNEPKPSNKGNNSSDIKFVDDSITVPMVKQQISKTDTNENDKSAAKKNYKTAIGKKDIPTGAHKTSNVKDKKKVRTAEPKVQCFRNITACENLARRSSPRKQAKRDSATAKCVSNDKGTSTQSVVNTSNDEMKNHINTTISPASNRKRKREEKSKEKGLEYKDDKLNDSKSPVKFAKKEKKRDAKQKESTDIQPNKGSVEKRPISNHGKDNDSCRMEEEKAMEELENDSCSDDELMETALSPNSKKFKFEFSDVVWAKLYREPFWPAQVKRISCTKPKKIYVQFLGYENKSCFSCRRLFPFACDSGKREEFMKEAELLDPQRFEVAFTMAEDLVRRKALGIKDQKEEEGEEEMRDLVDTDEVKENGNDGEESASSVADDEPAKEANVSQLRRSVKRPSKYKDILTYIRDAKPFLREIFEEKRDCERHQIFKKGSAKDKNSLKRRSGFGPVADSDLENDIMELLQDYYRELVGSKEDFSEITYISDVWLPEAIIYALQQIENVDRRAAESIFQRGTYSEETQIHRFTQQLKAKTLTQEEKEESLQRAQQRLRASAN